jgi:hypothetical protein
LAHDLTITRPDRRVINSWRIDWSGHPLSHFVHCGPCRELVASWSQEVAISRIRIVVWTTFGKLEDAATGWKALGEQETKR